MKFGVRPLVVTLPFSALALYYRFSDLQLSVNGEISSWLVDVLSQHMIIFLFAAATWAYFISLISAWFAHCAERGSAIDLPGLMGLYETFEQIVSAKEGRFRNALMELEKGRLKSDPSAIFLEITRPDQQIALLVMGLRGFFDSLAGNKVNFKVTLATIDGDVPVEWYFFDPGTDPPRTPIEVLRAPNSGIRRAVRTKGVVVIEDLVCEAGKGVDGLYVPDPERKVEDGSMLCYPICDPVRSKVPFVLSVVADRKKYFESAKAPLYEWTLSRFALRIRLEYHLHHLKEKANTAPDPTHSERRA